LPVVRSTRRTTLFIFSDGKSTFPLKRKKIVGDTLKPVAFACRSFT
jgi:hypothetical protein